MGNHPEFSHSRWRSASGGGNCVEVTYQDGWVGVRDSKSRGQGPVLAFSMDAWQRFIASLKTADTTE